MNIIPWSALAWCAVPIVIVAVIYWRWQGSVVEVLYATARMFLQLIAIGYLLVILFENPSPWLSSGILSVMLVAASWIAIRPVRHKTGYLAPTISALFVAVGFHLLLSLIFVLEISQWYSPSILIPLAGMYFANTMNAISLAAERHSAELVQHQSQQKACLTAFHAAMIPQINGLLAVGLVALPGMMTGQILSGVSPLVAVRYQVMIMAMILGASAMGVALMLWMLQRRADNQTESLG